MFSRILSKFINPAAASDAVHFVGAPPARLWPTSFIKELKRHCATLPAREARDVTRELAMVFLDGPEESPQLSPDAEKAMLEVNQRMRLHYYRCRKRSEAGPTADKDVTIAPPHRVNPEHVIRAYGKGWKSDYRRTLGRCLSYMEPMDSDCKLSVCIPVAASEEAGRIYSTLENLSKQTVAKRHFEAMVLFNFSAKQWETAGTEIRTCRKEIARAKKDFANTLQISVAPIQIADWRNELKDVISMGLLRSVNHDLVLLNLMRRNTGYDHILVRCDADMRGVDCEFVRNYLDCFAARPEAHAMQGMLLWSLESCVNDPLQFLNLSLSNGLEMMQRVTGRWHELDRGGPNFAIRASSYAQLGGYDDAVNLAEDVDLCRRLRRQSGSNIDFAGLRSRVYTSARRADVALRETGSCAPAQWLARTTFFALDNAHIRRLPEMRPLAEPYRFDQNDYERLINRHFRDSLGAFPEGERLNIAQRFLGRVLKVDCECQPQEEGLISVHVRNIQGFLTMFEKMRRNVAAGEWIKRLHARIATELLPKNSVLFQNN